MSLPVADLIDQVQVQLFDPDGVRWPAGELLEWLNEAVREIIRFVPDAGVVTLDHALVAGTRQALPANGQRLIDVMSNVTGGTAIRPMDKSLLDVYRPGWRLETSTVVEGFMYDPKDPDVFEVFPGRAGAASVRIVYQAIPTEVGDGDNLPLDDIYQAGVVNYVLARAYLKDSEDSSADFNRANAYYQSFLQTLGIKQQVDMLAEPLKK